MPGRVQAEDYDTGGEGVAYHDTDAANLGGAYRPSEGVDLKAVQNDTGANYIYNGGAAQVTGSYLEP